MPLSCHKIIN